MTPVSALYRNFVDLVLRLDFICAPRLDILDALILFSFHSLYLSGHAFPPDIGQGINAGFQDVVALDSALRGVDIRSGKDLTTKKKPASLADALQAYQSNRGPEHKALIRLARFGAPFQYRQPWRRHRVGNLIWTANVAFRLLLNKISFGLIPPAAIVIMVQDHSLTFRQVMRRADLTALGLKLLSLAWLFRMIVKKFGLAL